MSDKKKWIKPEPEKAPVPVEVKTEDTKKKSTREKMYGK